MQNLLDGRKLEKDGKIGFKYQWAVDVLSIKMVDLCIWDGYLMVNFKIFLIKVTKLVINYR